MKEGREDITEKRLKSIEERLTEIEKSIDNLKEAYESFRRFEITEMTQDLPYLLLILAFSLKTSDKLTNILKLALNQGPPLNLIIEKTMEICHNNKIPFNDMASGIIAGLGEELANQFVTIDKIAEIYGAKAVKEWRTIIGDPPNQKYEKRIVR